MAELTGINVYIDEAAETATITVDTDDQQDIFIAMSGDLSQRAWIEWLATSAAQNAGVPYKAYQE